MPGTTRYSATFDRPYEEEDRPASEPSNGSRRSRSQSWQANMVGDVRPYTPLGHTKSPPQRSSSTDSGTSSGTEHIPTRTASKTVVKTHNNPFQFVKVASCPLYKKAAEQLQKVKEVKKPEVLKEEEEEWQTNLDSWKSRRRKMSEDVFRRQEEIRQFEQEEQSSQIGQKKTKTFSEMVESRANRGRALSLCLISGPLELQEWEVQTNKSSSSHPFSEGSEENSAVNSEDEGVGEKRVFQKNLWSDGSNGNSLKNGSTNGCKTKTNETSYADSGLESISSSHRMGDTPDSCSDFSQDSGSSIDCDSPRVSGLLLNSVNILEDFNTKSISRSDCEDSFTNSKTDSEVITEKEVELKEKNECSNQEAQHVTESNANSTSADVSSDTIVSEGSIDSCAPKSSSNDDFENNRLERSIESENEVFVDDFEELNSQSKVFCPNALQTSNESSPLKSNNDSEKSSYSSKKQSGPSRKSGINLIKFSIAAEKLNSISEKSNTSDCTEIFNSNKGSENLKFENDAGKTTSENSTKESNVCKDKRKSKFVDSSEKFKPNKVAEKLSAVKCIEKSINCKSTMNDVENLKSSNDFKKSSVVCDAEKSKALGLADKLKTSKDTKKLNAMNGLENLKSSNDVEKSSVVCDTEKSKALDLTDKPKICKDTKKLNATNTLQNFKSNNDVSAPSVNSNPVKSNGLNCTEKPVSTNKLRTTIAKEKSDISLNTQESTSESSSQNLKSNCKREISRTKNLEKPKSSEKNKTENLTEENNNSIEKSDNHINAEKLNTDIISMQKSDVDKKTYIHESQNNEGSSIDAKEEKPKVHSEEGETKKPKNVIRRKKKRATAKIVSMEITNDNINSSENQKKSVVSSPQISEDSLNLVFQSQSSKNKESASVEKISTTNNTEKVLLNDVPPVEKIAEEMEKLILQQLEEEERAKEMSTKLSTTDLFASPEHNLIAPPKMAEPPKEKPPPPPVVENDAAPKGAALKRVNSTKRIKKEIHKRMSNFLGIEADENGICDESSVPPPPALEQILKVEVELEKESRKRLESAAEERLRLEETEIIEKEQEIIANLETEERQRQLFNNAEICDFLQDEVRIQKLKEERKKMENERSPRLRLEEEKQLREREKLIRQQEALVEISAPVLSDAENLSNKTTASNASSLCLDTKSNVSLSSIGGEGKTISNFASGIVDGEKSEIKEKPTVPPKPEVPPKPLKKKEAIRKERERLRQEQESLQREREEHRLKLLKEQEKNNPKPYAPNAPVSRLGPIPPLKPPYNPQLTNPPPPSTRENVIYTSQSYPGAQNGISGTSGCIEPVLNKPSKPVSSHKKAVQSDAWVPQKVSPVKKQSLESSPESKYNQNHWLIQEAEMRRIAELKERQLYPQTHLAEDEVCSTSTSAPAAMASPPLQEKVWSYGHSNMLVKKYPSPASVEKPVGLYPAPKPQPPAKPSRVVPMDRPEHILSVSGRKRCSHCTEELGRGAAMIIESLQLYYHIQCFQCCVCQAQLGNGSCGTDVRVRNNKLHCHNCYSNDEAGLKFSQV